MKVVNYISRMREFLRNLHGETEYPLILYLFIPVIAVFFGMILVKRSDFFNIRFQLSVENILRL